VITADVHRGAAVVRTFGTVRRSGCGGPLAVPCADARRALSGPRRRFYLGACEVGARHAVPVTGPGASEGLVRDRCPDDACTARSPVAPLQQTRPLGPTPGHPYTPFRCVGKPVDTHFFAWARGYAPGGSGPKGGPAGRLSTQCGQADAR
jgi:hypothetical protein